jgi:hypothetical protein
VDLDDAIFEQLFGEWEGAVALDWEVASRCSCYSTDSRQPDPRHELCKGYGVVYAEPVRTAGLFRSRSQWLSFRAEGELEHGEATLTLPLDVKPHYTDRRVRDRFRVVSTDDSLAGRVFVPAAQPVPFVFANVQRAWRVQVQMLAQDNRLVPAP